MAALCCTEWRHSVVSSNPSRTPWVPLIVGAPIVLEIIMSQHRFKAESGKSAPISIDPELLAKQARRRRDSAKAA
jgi:hypothetical protein